MGKNPLTKTLTVSRTASGVGYLGDAPETLWDVLLHAWECPFTVASNFARDNAVVVAFAASMGWLSTISPTGHAYTNLWHLTFEGAVALRNKESF